MSRSSSIAKLSKSPKTDKKFRVVFPSTGKKVDFGGRGYSDYTKHKDPERMRAYVRRHGGIAAKGGGGRPATKSSKEDWTDPTTAGFWSRWLLWSYPTMAEAKKFIQKKFGIRIIMA